MAFASQLTNVLKFIFKACQVLNNNDTRALALDISIVFDGVLNFVTSFSEQIF